MMIHPVDRFAVAPDSSIRLECNPESEMREMRETRAPAARRFYVEDTQRLTPVNAQTGHADSFVRTTYQD
jgi:hypothetical protein